MTYVLHYAPDNASLIVRLALDEMELPYTTRLVDRQSQAQSRAAYRAINPVGLIPALETPHGVMFETAAILLWLADCHGRLAPSLDAPERTSFLSHLFFTSNTLHAQMRLLFYPDKYVGPDAAAQAQLRRTLQQKDATVMTLRHVFALMDRWASDHAGFAPSVLDYYLACLVRWCALYPKDGNAWFDLHDYPALLALACALEVRPPALAAQAEEGLGPTPFSSPHYPTPPEGSAL